MGVEFEIETVRTEKGASAREGSNTTHLLCALLHLETTSSLSFSYSFAFSFSISLLQQ